LLLGKKKAGAAQGLCAAPAYPVNQTRHAALCIPRDAVYIAQAYYSRYSATLDFIGLAILAEIRGSGALNSGIFSPFSDGAGKR
jgi:hypothetical protein